MATRLILHIDDPTPEWLALAAAQPPGTLTAATDVPALTTEAAARLIELVTPDAAYLLKLATDGDGRALGADFRAQRGEGRLNGATTSITRTINSLTRQGVWPAGVSNPLTPTTAGKEGWSKTYAYHLNPRALPAFRAAFTRTETPRTGDPQRVIDRLIGMYEEMGRPTHLARECAADFLNEHADDLAAWLLTRRTPRRQDAAAAQNITAGHDRPGSDDLETSA
ncbi:hypothetical protein [Streptomyces lavendulocolor]|uniref:hypothetical protein n=1 Tax=Streptomyces lavendulocolor TaxID=67316 RepID=UPI0031D5C99C